MPNRNYTDLIHLEASLSRDILSYLPRSWQGQFFCLDENTWVWSEGSSRREVVVRYRLRGPKVYKQIKPETEWRQLSLTEAKNLRRHWNFTRSG